jgi:hypothetical protein
MKSYGYVQYTEILRYDAVIILKGKIRSYLSRALSMPLESFS